MNIKTCFIGLGLGILTTTGLFFPAPAILSAQSTAEVIIAQAQKPIERKRIAVLDFDFASTSGTGFYYDWLGIGPAKGVSDLLTNALVKDGTYIVLERSKVEEILKEQNFGASGRVDASTAAQIGKILGADAVIIGTITQFNVEQSRSGLNLGGFLGGLGGGKEKNKAIVQVNSRLVSTTTGEILAVAEGEGKADKSGGGIRFRGISGDTSTNNVDSLLSAAAESAIAKMSGELVTANNKLATLPSVVPTVSAIVADITGNLITINKGSESGFRSGMNLSIERVVKQVKDPQTGKVLRSITSPIGRVELIEVSNGYATGKIVSGSGFKVQDVAKPVQ
ncbi:CsgG/HfaB family protein [Synechocystis sp. PCC 7509]|uniref:CsgG/HfaB family protein n=1 Tax=Synechocystis sp. PCC 7509 TaxID=927677 RepID=UPI0003122E11|nr:CsgG/HfaB family protein [Synechocystis sp. PCC 7509]